VRFLLPLRTVHAGAGPGPSWLHLGGGKVIRLSLIWTLFWVVPSPAGEVWTLLWRRWIGVPPVPPASVGDTLFVPSPEGTIWAVSAKDGRAVWRTEIEGPVRAGPSVRGRTVWVGDLRGRLYGLDRVSGEVLWVRRLWGKVGHSPVSGPSGVYVATGAGLLYSLDEEGRERWRVRVPSAPASGPVLAGEFVVYPGSDGDLRAYDVEDGELAWISDLDGITAGPVQAGEVVLVGCGGYARAIRVGDGGIAWEVFLSEEVRGVAVSGTKALFASTGGWIYGLDLTDGELLWRRRIGPPGCYGIISSGEALYITGPEGLFFISPRTGDVLRKWPLGGPARWAIGFPEGVFAVAGDGYLYSFGKAPPGPEDALWEEWAEVRYKGVKVGYRHSWAERDTTGFSLFREEVNWQNGFRRTSFAVRTDSTYVLRELKGEYKEADQLLTVLAIADSGLLRTERSGPGAVLRDTFRVGPLVPSFALVRRLAARSFSDTMVSVFDVCRLVPADERVSVLGPDTSEGIPCVRLKMGEDLIAWADGAGSTLRIWAPDLEEEVVAVSPEEALAWSPPELQLFVPLDLELPPFRRVGELVLRLPHVLGIPSDGRQQVQTFDGEMEVRVTQALPEDTTHPDRYLSPTLFLQADHPEIVEVAGRISEGLDDPEEKARRALAWTYSHVRPEETPAKFLTALEVLREGRGTCTEYSVLFIALCRAMGVPARAAVGLLGAGGRLVPHMWAQAYVGTWVDVDPSYGQFGVDAAHLALAYGDVSIRDLPGANRILQLALARWDTARVERVRADGEVYLPEAERLWRAYEEAERGFRDEEAVRLLQELLSLPENRRTAPALYRLGVLLGRKGKKAEAREMLLRLLREFPGSDPADDALYKLAELSEPKEALRLLERLVRDFPDSPLADDALHRIADIHRRLGDREAAGRALRVLSERYPDSPWARRSK